MEAIYSIENSYRASMLEKERRRNLKLFCRRRSNSNLAGQQGLDKKSIHAKGRMVMVVMLMDHVGIYMRTD